MFHIVKNYCFKKALFDRLYNEVEGKLFRPNAIFKIPFVLNNACASNRTECAPFGLVIFFAVFGSFSPVHCKVVAVLVRVGYMTITRMLKGDMMPRMLETIENTLTLVGYSVKYAYKHKQLLMIPLISSIAVILSAGIVLWFLAYFYNYFPNGLRLTGGFVLFMVLVGLVGTIGELVLSHAVGNLFRTGSVSISNALGKGFRRFGRTVMWVMLHALIHVIASGDKRRSFLGELVILGWNLATLFIIPVFAFEDLGVYASIKRSAAIFENHFGKTAVASFSFGTLSFALLLAPMILIPIVSYFQIWPIFFVAYGIFFVIVGAFISLADAIFTTALYFYVRGESVGGIDTRVLERSFSKKQSEI